MECCSEKVCESLSSYRYSWKAERQESNGSHALKEVAIYFRNATIRSGNKLNRMCLTRYVFQTGECALVRERSCGKSNCFALPSQAALD